LPAVLMHWTHLVTMVILIFTGFYIHWPFFPGFMGVARNLHFVFMFVLIFGAIVRVYWAFFGAGSAPLGGTVKRGDYKFFGPQKENKGTLVGTIKYYTFLQKEAPPVSKYNGLQKGTYVFWLFLIAFQALTGFMLWTPTATALLPLTYAMGGVITVRMIHYLVMWLFIVTVLIHIYLAVMHWDEFLMMFFYRQSSDAATAPSAPANPPAGTPQPSGRTP
jgi:Ni/Fe-hydrogenase 1 B-type cytochrome subunit